MRVIGQVPIHRALCDGWDEQLLVSHKAVAVVFVIFLVVILRRDLLLHLPLLVLLTQTQKTSFRPKLLTLL